MWNDWLETQHEKIANRRKAQFQRWAKTQHVAPKPVSYLSALALEPIEDDELTAMLHEWEQRCAEHTD